MELEDELFSHWNFILAESSWQCLPLDQIHQPAFHVEAAATASAAAAMATATRGGGSSTWYLLVDASQLGCNNGWRHEERMAARTGSNGSGHNIARRKLIDETS